MLDCSNRPSYQRMSSTQQIRKQFLAPKRQPVLDEFKCWISSSTLIQGHLYCMETHLSFYAGDGDSPIRVYLFSNTLQLTLTNLDRYSFR